MFKFLSNRKGFTITEVMFVAVITTMAIASILAAWVFTYSRWSNENVRTSLRIDMLKAIEVMKNDIRFSSMTDIVFYPDTGPPYTGMSMPGADKDVNDFFTLDANGNIVWDRTVIYHVYTSPGGDEILRRTVFDPINNAYNEEERYTQLSNTVSNGTGGSGSTTDENFLKNLDTFEISPLSSEIDFYDESATAVKVGKLVFGWAKIGSGDHTIRFEITGQNALSLGFDIGIDNIMIEPSGWSREMEYYASSYAPAGMLTLSGGTTSRVHNTVWSHHNYLEFNATLAGDYFEIVDNYDLFRDSLFYPASLNNLTKTGEEIRAGLDTPGEDERGNFTWGAWVEAGDSVNAGHDLPLPLSDWSDTSITVRNVITQDNISLEGDLVRVSFKASTDDALEINKAYISKRNGTSGADGLANQDTTSYPDAEDFHRHQQLFFKNDATGDIEESITVSAGEEEWSEWSAFPVRTDSDYLITIHVTDVYSTTDYKYWEGADSDVRSYFVAGAYTTAGTPDWTGVTPDDTSEDIFMVNNIDVWSITGNVESGIFDSAMASPSYNQVKWSESKPSGTSISLKERASSSPEMAGATDWTSITGSSTNPHSFAGASNRYAQFYAELSTDMYWATAGSSVGYETYIDDQVDNYDDYDFPVDGSSDIYVTGVYSTWIDDVEVDWPGDERICTITGYVAKRNDYGQAKITIDGEGLLKVLSIHVKVAKDVSDLTVDAENYLEIEPLNTGK